MVFSKQTLFVYIEPKLFQDIIIVTLREQFGTDHVI